MRIEKLLLLLIGAIFITGCSWMMSIDYEKDSLTKVSFEDFKSGEAVLASGEVTHIYNYRGLWKLNKNGNYLAATHYVLNYFPRDALAYFHLGFAAEGMGLKEAAIRYYQRSKEIDKVWCDKPRAWKDGRMQYWEICEWYQPDQRIAELAGFAHTDKSAHAMEGYSKDYISQQILLAERRAKEDEFIRDNWSVFDEPEMKKATAKFKEDMNKALPLMLLAVAVPDVSDSPEIRGLKHAVIEYYSGSKIQVTPSEQQRQAWTTIPLSPFTTTHSKPSSSIKSTGAGFRSQSPNSQVGSCACRCINGSVQYLCRNSYDIRPACPSTVCPTPLPSVRPVNKPIVPPIGSKSCSYEEVYSQAKNAYEWTQLCQ